MSSAPISVSAPPARSIALARRFALAATVLALLAGPAAANGKFDGAWSVEVVTRQGHCDSYKWRIDIAAGKIVDIENNLAEASGSIDGHGSVSVTLKRGADRLMAKGSLATRTGAGEWDSPTRACSGEWRAVRL